MLYSGIYILTTYQPKAMIFKKITNELDSVCCRFSHQNIDIFDDVGGGATTCTGADPSMHSAFLASEDDCSLPLTLTV